MEFCWFFKEKITDKFLTVPDKGAHEAGAAAEGLALELVTGNWHRAGEDFGQTMFHFCNEVKLTVITLCSIQVMRSFHNKVGSR